jgi:hypothetical protein
MHPCLMEWGLMLASVDEKMTSVLGCVFWCRWHYVGQLDRDHNHDVDSFELSFDVHHP